MMITAVGTNINPSSRQNEPIHARRKLLSDRVSLLNRLAPVLEPRMFVLQWHSHFATIDTTSSSATTWLKPHLWGRWRALAPQTIAYLNVSFRVRWT